MEQKETAQVVQAPKVLFSVTAGSVLHALLVSLSDQWASRGTKYNHSVEYWAETCLADGITARARQLKSSRERDVDSAYIAEVQRLDPTTSDYAEKVAKVNLRFGRGATQVEVNPRLAAAARLVNEL